MTNKLVIVESPAKAKTLGNFLGPEYKVTASFGHIVDLPKSKTGVDPEHDFAITYVVPDKSIKVVADLKKLAKDAKEIYLATDPDREGEAIAWHLADIVGARRASPAGRSRPTPTNHIKRVVFHEITKAAVAESFAHPGVVDMNLVDAQQARRVLDRLVGYELSPFLWKKIIYGLSAGRVQSVAVRLIVERERERQAFKAEEYWRVELKLSPTVGATRGSPAGGSRPAPTDFFIATLIEKNGKKLKLGNAKITKETVQTLEKSDYVIKSVEQTERKRNPYPPFTTASLQQAAGNVLGMTAKRAMDAAQKLFEAGFITYHRTDSTNLSAQFLTDVRAYITKEFGSSYLPAKAIVYATKSKNAQEAHEAIRPTVVQHRVVPDTGSLGTKADDASRLYELIWRRAAACQMTPAVFDQVSVDVAAGIYGLRSTATSLKFDGWLKASPATESDDTVTINNKLLKGLVTGSTVYPILPIDSAQHFTEPPARYTEASLIKVLEEYGIGRPSTYAPTINTIQTRGYVAKEGRALYPKDVALVVNDLLVKHFPNIVDYKFTAKMEDQLDEVAAGTIKWIPVIREWYEPFHKNLLVKDKELKKSDFVNLGIVEGGKKCPECGAPLEYKLSRYGKFISCSAFPKCKHAEYLDTSGEQVLENEGSDGQAKVVEDFSDQLVGGCPECHKKLMIKTGPFGKFIACESYPDCKFTKTILRKIGMKCPKCRDGEIVKRLWKNKKTFYGCTNYPKCDFVSWKNPKSSASVVQ